MIKARTVDASKHRQRTREWTRAVRTFSGRAHRDTIQCARNQARHAVSGGVRCRVHCEYDGASGVCKLQRVVSDESICRRRHRPV